MTMNKELQKLGVDYAQNHPLNNASDILVPTGSFALDRVIGGGIPVGRITELYGWESSGKSLLLYSAMARAQQMGGLAILADAEKAYIPQWGANHGIDNSKLLYFSPDSVERFFKVMVNAMNMCKAKNIWCIMGCDSVAALCSEEDTLDSGGYHTKRAIMMSRGLSTLCRDFYQYRMALVFINQLRDKMGGNAGPMGGNAETTPGGNAIKFFASLRLKMVGKKPDKDEEGDTQGIMPRVKVIKSKVCAPHKECEIYLHFDSGISKYHGLLPALVKEGVVDHKDGSTWYSLDGKRFQKNGFIDVYTNWLAKKEQNGVELENEGEE